MNRILVLDTETTTTNFRDPNCNDGPNGHIVEIGIVSLDLRTGNIEDVYHAILKDPNATGNEWVYQNTDLKFRQPCYDAPDIVNAELMILLNKEPITAFNQAFDRAMLERDFPDAVKWSMWAQDIMLAADAIDDIPRKVHDTSTGFRSYPSVQSTLNYLFPGQEIIEKHRALQDARDEARILFELYLRGLYKV